MNRNRQMTAQQSIGLAQQRLQQMQIPQGAYRGAMAGQAPVYAQGMVPQGADAGAMAGCGPDGGCATGYIPSPFANMGLGVNNSPTLQPNALLGIFVQPATAAAVTLEISCGNTFFNGCGARSFGSAEGGQNLLTSIVSGFDTRDQLCPGSGIDVAFFHTTDCYCPFAFGCFSNLAPLLITFDPIDTQSTLAPLNMVIVGDRLEFDGCFPFPWGNPWGNGSGGYPGGGYPPGMPPMAGGGGQLGAMLPQSNPRGWR